MGSSLSRPEPAHRADNVRSSVSRQQTSPVPCQRPRRAHATYTPDATRAAHSPPPGSGLAPRAGLCPGDTHNLRFRRHRSTFRCVRSGSSMFVFSSHTVRPVAAGLFRSRFPPRLLTGMTLRRFEFSVCSANPEDLPPSLAQHASCWGPPTSSSLHFQDTRGCRSCRRPGEHRGDRGPGRRWWPGTCGTRWRGGAGAGR